MLPKQPHANGTHIRPILQPDNNPGTSSAIIKQNQIRPTPKEPARQATVSRTIPSVSVKKGTREKSTASVPRPTSSAKRARPLPHKYPNTPTSQVCVHQKGGSVYSSEKGNA